MQLSVLIFTLTFFFSLFGQSSRANDLPEPSLISSVLAEFHKRSTELFEEHDSSSWVLCEELVNMNKAGASVFIEASLRTEHMLEYTLGAWIAELGLPDEVSASDVHEALSLEPIGSNPRIGLRSALWFIDQLSQTQREALAEIYGDQEHPIFQILSEILLPYSDPDEVLDALKELEKSSFKPEGQLLTRFYNQILTVIGSDTKLPVGVFGTPVLSEVSDN